MGRPIHPVEADTSKTIGKLSEMRTALIVILCAVALTFAVDQPAMTTQAQDLFVALGIDDFVSLATDETNPPAVSTSSTQCPIVNWNDEDLEKACRLDRNATWQAWARLHFPRETTNCRQGRTCWAGLYCERDAPPSNPCAYSTTELCMRAGNRTDARCKAIYTVQCPCEGGKDALQAALEKYTQAFGQEWRSQHPEGSDEQFKEACETSQYMSIMAKQEMLACVKKKCGARYSADDWDDDGGGCGGDDDDDEGGAKWDASALTAAPSTAATQGGPCKNWCATHKKAWTSKCKWKKCAGCSACSTDKHADMALDDAATGKASSRHAWAPKDTPTPTESPQVLTAASVSGMCEF